jgi:hypothetical protein
MKDLSRAQLRALNKSLEHRLGREKKWSALLKRASLELLCDLEAAARKWAEAVGVAVDEEEVPAAVSRAHKLGPPEVQLAFEGRANEKARDVGPDAAGREGFPMGTRRS